MKLVVFLRWMIRESRGARGRMVYFIACLAVGVAAVVGAAALSEAFDASVRSKSREILGGDLTVQARRVLPEGLDTLMSTLPGVERTNLVETATMVTLPSVKGTRSPSQLCQLVAVDGRYPLYGELGTEPPGGLAPHLRDSTAVVGVDLLSMLDVEIGDVLLIGGRRFQIAATIHDEPAQFGFQVFLGPRVYVTQAGLAETGLLGFGTRSQHRALFALSGQVTRTELEALGKRIETEVEDAAFLDVDNHYEAGPGGRQAFQRVEGFIGLVALLSLVIGGIGVAQIVRAWTQGRTGAIAVLRCLGLRPAEILVMSLGHVVLLAAAGSVIGAGIGCAIPSLVASLLPDVLPADLKTVFPLAAMLRGIGLGVGLAVVFSLPPLTAIWRVPPARVLRADADPLPPSRIVSVSAAAALLVGVLGASWVQAGALLPALWFTGGFAVLVGVLVLGARGLMKLSGKLPRGRMHPYLRHGVAALGRPGAGTTGAVVALGLGTMVVTSMWLVETRIRAAILSQVPENAPSVFLIDIRPQQWDDVRSKIAAAGATRIDQVPVVTARIAAIDGRSIDELARAAENSEEFSRRTLTREQRLTWSQELMSDNKIVAGALWSEPDVGEVSLETRFAERLGVGLGSMITFDVQGVPIETKVTSLREVEWQSFSINFFVVLEPGVIDRAPALYLANATVPPENEQALQDAVAQIAPNVTLIRVRPLLDQLLGLLERLVGGLRLLGWFTVAAGVMILAGAVSATALRRGAEVALLKTLGVTRGGVGVLLATEYGLCGVLAGGVGAGGALLLAWGYLRYVADLDIALPLWVLPAVAIGCGLLTAVCGVAASARALTVRPIEALR